MACCPEGALGQLGTEGYVCKGKVEKVDDLDLYVVGSGNKCIIWNYDIFGFDSGRYVSNAAAEKSVKDTI